MGPPVSVPRCPDGKIMVMDCTPWSNINCVDQESGPPSRLVIAIIVIGLVITAVLIGCMVWCCLKDSECPACSHRPRALCSVSEPPTCTLSLGREVRQECPPHHSVDVSSLLSLFNECWHKEKKLTEDNAQSRDAASRLPVETSSP
nr:PREDICTED: uncharacterized protein LOC109563126 isoform X3 [Bos indicus]